MATFLTGMLEPVEEGHMRNTPQAHICSKLPKLSCKVTKPFGFFVCLHFLLRNCLYENKVLNFPLEIEYIGFKSTATELAVFFIGVYLFVLCGLSMFSLIHIVRVLGAERMKHLILRPQDLITPRAGRHILTVFFMPFSIYYSVWLFFFVRQKWSSNFAEPVQVLHLLPTCFFLLHTIAEVLVLMSTNAMMLSGGNRQLSCDDYKDLVTHVRKIGSVNTVFIVYCVSMLFIVFFEGLPNALDTMAILFELFFRICFLSSTCCLEDKMEKTPIQVQERTDEHTQNVYVLPFSQGALCGCDCIPPVRPATRDCSQWPEIIPASEATAGVDSAIPEAHDGDSRTTRGVFPALPQTHYVNSQMRGVFPVLPQTHYVNSQMRGVFPVLPQTHYAGGQMVF